MATTWFPDGWELDVPNPGWGELMVAASTHPYHGEPLVTEDWQRTLDGPELGAFLTAVTRRAFQSDLAWADHAAQADRVGVADRALVAVGDPVPTFVTPAAARALLPVLQEAVVQAVAGDERYERTFRDDDERPRRPSAPAAAPARCTPPSRGSARPGARSTAITPTGWARTPGGRPRRTFTPGRSRTGTASAATRVMTTATMWSCPDERGTRPPHQPDPDRRPTMSAIPDPAAELGPAPDLSEYDTTASAAAHEWFLSDHPWAVAERNRRRETNAARALADAAQVREWADRTHTADAAGELAGHRAAYRDNLVRLADSMGPSADRAQLRVTLEDAAPDDVWVAEERRRWAVHMRVSGEGPDSYTYPTHLTGPGAAGYPPPPEGFQRRGMGR